MKSGANGVGESEQEMRSARSDERGSRGTGNGAERGVSGTALSGERGRTRNDENAE